MIFALPHQIIACVAVLLCYNSNNISLTKFDVRTAQKQSTLVPVSTLVNNAAEDAPGRGCTFRGDVECASPENVDIASSADSAGSAAFASSADSAGSAHGSGGSAHGSDGSAHGSDGGAHGSDGSAHGSDGSAHGSDGSAHGSDGAGANGDGSAGDGGGGHEEGNAHASEKHGIGQSSLEYNHMLLFAVAFIFVLIQSVLHVGGRQLTVAHLASFYNNPFAKFYVVASMFLAVSMYLVFTLDCEGMYHYVARCYIVYSLTILYLLQNYSNQRVWLYHFSGAQILIVFLFSATFTIVIVEFRDACDAVFPFFSIGLMLCSPGYKLVCFFVFDPPTVMSQSTKDLEYQGRGKGGARKKEGPSPRKTRTSPRRNNTTTG